MKKRNELCEKLLIFTNRELENKGLRRNPIIGETSGAEAIYCDRGILSYIVTVNPGGEDVGDLEKFLSTTLGDKSGIFDTSTDVVLKEINDGLGFGKKGKETLIEVTFSRKRDLSDAQNMMIVFKEMKEIEDLDFQYSIENNSKIKEKFDINKTISYIGIDNKFNNLFLDIKKENSILIAGASGSGKSNFSHNIVNSLIMKNSPDELQIAISDPKDGVEFGHYYKSSFFKDYGISQTDISCLGQFGLLLKEYDRIAEILIREKARSVEHLKSDIKKKENIKTIVYIIDELHILLNEEKYGKIFTYLLDRYILLFRFCGIFIITNIQTTEGVPTKLLGGFNTKISFLQNNWRNYQKFFWTSNWSKKLRGMGDGIILKNGELKRFQSCIVPIEMMKENINKSEIECDFKEKKLKEEKGLVFLKEKYESCINNDDFGLLVK